MIEHQGLTVQWWGHSTTTIGIGGLRFLTDPLLSGRLAHLRRIGGPDPAPAVLRADAVLISHLHSDHLHIPSLIRLSEVAGQTPIIAPSGTRRLLQRRHPALAQQVREVRPGDGVSFADVTVTVLAALHDGRRSPVSRHQGPALGYLLESSGKRVWFAGDTGPTDAFAALRPVDIALIPVGGWGPTLGEGHLDPVQAAQAAKLVGAAHAVPIHYGTFWPIGLRRVHPRSYAAMFTSPGWRFADALALAAQDCTAHVLSCGAQMSVPT